MQQDLEITTGSVKSRQRALRLIRHVAIGIAELKTPTNDEIIALCTEHTTLNCMLVCFGIILSDMFQGGFLFQHWLTFAGPKWALKIISERQSVESVDDFGFYLFLSCS